jgi:hypothetical protein
MSANAQPQQIECRKRGTLTRQACDSCFRSKRKCDGKKPCYQCLQNGQVNCDYKRPHRRMVSSRRRTDSEPTRTESIQLEMNVADSESSLSGSRKVLLPPVTSDSTDTSNLLKGNNLANNSIRDSEQAEPENLDANRTVPREFGTFFIPLSPSQMDLESFYPESSMMELDWLFGVSNGQDIPPFNSSSPQWNSSQISAPNYHQPMAKHRSTVQASVPAILEPMRVEKPSPMSSHLSNTPSWPTDYLSNVDDSDHNQLMAAASPQDQAQRYEHEQTLARSTQSRCSYFPQELGRIAIEGRIDELPKYLDDDCRRVISVAFWEKWVSKRQGCLEIF